MINFLITSAHDFLARHGLWGYLRVFTYLEFRAVCSLLLSFTLVLLLGNRTIRWLMRMKIGDRPEFYNDQLNELMKQKANTPTMGGILIVGAITVSTLLLADLSSFYVQMALLCLIWLAAVGMWDDWLKLTSSRRAAASGGGGRRREGLYFWEKLLYQVGLAVLLGLFIHHYAVNKPFAVEEQLQKMSHAINLPFMKTWVWNAQLKTFVPSPTLLTLGAGSFVLLSVLVIVGSSNAVNLTDGMDGLVCGIMSIVALAFMILALIAGDDGKAKYLLVPYIPLSDELAVVAGAMVGSSLAFLWFNCNPARVFMGDTGSLALGGLLGYIAVVIRQEFLLLIIGGVFVAEALSVMLQVGYFKFTGGKRIFRCAPIHHHFHMGGWTEQQVVVRFWIISAILAALALATIKLR